MTLRVMFLVTQLVRRDIMVANQARRIGFSPDTAVAVSRAENTRAIENAVSPQGAIGWMQVEPAWIGTFKKDCGPSGDLFDSTYNVCVGVHVLRFYWYRCHHDMNCTLAAYNGATEVADIETYLRSVQANL